ncbi:hypothetical protein [uncultured Sphingomonas sp.]|uniref:hypothetical protein n=1 Tax=uncultured Sphingomonas sp. TaxID=158754 RepID=UPI0035CC6916
MRLGKYIAPLAVMSMVAAPALAAPANPAASLSVAKSVRAGSSTKKSSHLVGPALIIGLLALAAVVTTVVIVADDSDSN